MWHLLPMLQECSRCQAVTESMQQHLCRVSINLQEQIAAKVPVWGSSLEDDQPCTISAALHGFRPEQAFTPRCAVCETQGTPAPGLCQPCTFLHKGPPSHLEVTSGSRPSLRLQC